jgi:hypothetical protein
MEEGLDPVGSFGDGRGKGEEDPSSQLHCAGNQKKYAALWVRLTAYCAQGGVVTSSADRGGGVLGPGGNQWHENERASGSDELVTQRQRVSGSN